MNNYLLFTTKKLNRHIESLEKHINGKLLEYKKVIEQLYIENQKKAEIIEKLKKI